MSIQRVGSPLWLQLLAPPSEVVCFLCGKAFDSNEDVVHWMGAGGPSSSYPELGLASDPTGILVMDELAKRGNQFGPGLDIFFHRDCVPSFCRRILSDWESLIDGEIPNIESISND